MPTLSAVRPSRGVGRRTNPPKMPLPQPLEAESHSRRIKVSGGTEVANQLVSADHDMGRLSRNSWVGTM